MKKGFTLAEVLITLAIIGVVAAITIPSVIVNTNQMEFKTGLRKAVSVLNQAITLNKALTGESPYDNGDLYNYLQQNMSVIEKNIVMAPSTDPYGEAHNIAFYTTDGMRFEIPSLGTLGTHYLHESGVKLNSGTIYTSSCTYNYAGQTGSCYCGSYGLAHNPDSTTNSPCAVLVDVNGDRKPNPGKTTSTTSTFSSDTGFSPGAWSYRYFTAANTDSNASYGSGAYSYPKPTDRLLKDVFLIMITDQGAIPYGVVAQKAMYQAQK